MRAPRELGQRHECIYFCFAGGRRGFEPTQAAGPALCLAKRWGLAGVRPSPEKAQVGCWWALFGNRAAGQSGLGVRGSTNLYRT